MKINLYERIVTHEGPEHFTLQDSINSPTLANDILKTCNYIADHIKKVSKANDRKRVKRMTLYFKIDCMERLFLLYASELLMKDETHSQKIAPKFTIPKEFRNIGTYAQTQVAANQRKKGEEGSFGLVEKKEHAYCSRCHTLFCKE